jgi:hypothetical protein
MAVASMARAFDLYSWPHVLLLLPMSMPFFIGSLSCRALQAAFCAWAIPPTKQNNNTQQAGVLCCPITESRLTLLPYGMVE